MESNKLLEAELDQRRGGPGDDRCGCQIVMQTLIVCSSVVATWCQLTINWRKTNNFRICATTGAKYSEIIIKQIFWDILTFCKLNFLPLNCIVLHSSAQFLILNSILSLYYMLWIMKFWNMFSSLMICHVFLLILTDLNWSELVNIMMSTGYYKFQPCPDYQKFDRIATSENKFMIKCFKGNCIKNWM